MAKLYEYYSTLLSQVDTIYINYSFYYYFFVLFNLNLCPYNLEFVSFKYLRTFELYSVNRAMKKIIIYQKNNV